MILRPGDRGTAVLDLQRLLRSRGANIDPDAIYGSATTYAVCEAQRRYGLVVDGIAGPKTVAALSANAARPGHLTAADLQRAAEVLGVPLASIRAVNEVESRGSGFLPDGRPVILFERHIMHRELLAAGLDADFHARQAPNLVNRARGGYAGGAAEHSRLARASEINLACALSATSWGLFQVMGYHAGRLGYPSVHAFADAMRSGEAAQLDAFVRFIAADPALHRALKARKWQTFASLYNGPAYKDNLYDVRLARAYARYFDHDQNQKAAKERA